MTPDTDATDLGRRAERIALEAAELAAEALRVRDQHAGRVDALAKQVVRLERENVELRTAISWLLAHAPEAQQGADTWWDAVARARVAMRGLGVETCVKCTETSGSVIRDGVVVCDRCCWPRGLLAWTPPAETQP
jgi:hypothetical protein